MITLRTLKNSDEKEFLKSNSEDWELDFAYAHYFESLAQNDFNKYVDILPQFSTGQHLPKGHVPCTFLFAFKSDGQIVGRVSIRHSLTDHLLKVGGHVGYGVVPSFRRKGYATKILFESINYIRSNIKSLNKVLVTCDEDNIGSRKTIERNNGILDNILTIEGSISKRRYWIKI